MGLPMTKCSFFLRGINFEQKNINAFGVSDVDVGAFLQTRDEEDTGIDNSSGDGPKKISVNELVNRWVNIEIKRECKLPHLDLD